MLKTNGRMDGQSWIHTTHHRVRGPTKQNKNSLYVSDVTEGKIMDVGCFTTEPI